MIDVCAYGKIILCICNIQYLSDFERKMRVMKKRSRMLSGAGLAKRALVMLLAFSMLVTGVVTAAPGDSGMKVYAESVVAVPTADSIPIHTPAEA